LARALATRRVPFRAMVHAPEVAQKPEGTVAILLPSRHETRPEAPEPDGAVLLTPTRASRVGRGINVPVDDGLTPVICTIIGSSRVSAKCVRFAGSV
jgi:hypothetical protein